jgi:chromosome segregation ATPase
MMDQSDVEQRVAECNRRLAEILGVNPEDPDAEQKIRERCERVAALEAERTRLQGWLNTRNAQEEPPRQ